MRSGTGESRRRVDSEISGGGGDALKLFLNNSFSRALRNVLRLSMPFGHLQAFIKNDP